MEHVSLQNEVVANDFLELFKISEKKYIIGVYHKGITVYKQQIRALNIFHALIKSGKIPTNDPNFAIGIIGGGIGGITFAAAAAKIGVTVRLFEKESIFMPMQYGCDTRIIHPNIYNWPDPRSTFPYAEIPILQWHADTGSNVAKQLVNSFQEIKSGIDESRIETLFDTVVTNIAEKPDGLFKVRLKQGSSIINRVVNLLIYATGYGVEDGVESLPNTPSYWRNDAFGQTILTKKNKKYIISGTGDGGFIDLFRLKIDGFSIDSFLTKLSQSPNYEVLIDRLRGIEKKWKELSSKEKEKKDWLYNEYEEGIDVELYSYILEEYLVKKRTKKTEVILHGKETSFEETLRLDRISMLNSFIAFLLSRNTNFFTYTDKPLVATKSGYMLGTTEFDGAVIMRRGSDRHHLLKEESLLPPQEKERMLEIERMQLNDRIYNTTDLLWTYSGLHSILNKNGPEKNYAFYTPETSSICSSFIAVLANALKFHQVNKFPDSKYRVCLHRAVNMGAKLGFQQITPYFEDTQSNSKSNLGRVYDIDKGVVGLSFKTGKVLLISKKDDKRFDELLSNLNLESSYQRYGSSALAIPILGHSRHGDLHTNLVCFLEAEAGEFFNNPDVVKLIAYAIGGFINYIDSSMEQQISMPEVDFNPINVDPFIPRPIAANPCFSDVENVGFGMFQDFNPFSSPLKFNRFYSFDITYRTLVDYLHEYN